MQTLTWISIAGTAFYVLTALACLAAAASTKPSDNAADGYWVWILMAVCFSLLTVARLMQWEEVLHFGLKDALQSSGGYGDRRVWQALAVAAVVALGAAAAIWFGRTMIRAGRGSLTPTFASARLAMLSLAGMIVLIILRVISFHPVDRLLYGARLNWALDPGLTLMVLGAAIWAIRRARQAG